MTTPENGNLRVPRNTHFLKKKKGKKERAQTSPISASADKQNLLPTQKVSQRMQL